MIRKKSKIEKEMWNDFFQVWKKSFCINGRTTRSELILFTVLNIVHMPIFFLFDVILVFLKVEQPFFTVFYIFLIAIPFPALYIRRLHDMGCSGWQIFNNILGEPEDCNNKFGQNPRNNES